MTGRPFVLVILDGWGVREPDNGNAITLAGTPDLDRIAKLWPTTVIKAAEQSVGLPEGQVGNSEVGHQNIGAGRRVLQDLVKINESIADGSFYKNKALIDAIQHAKNHHSRLHICGLLGDGGVHAHQKHLEATLRLAHMYDLDDVYIHCFTDGRDSSPTSSLTYLQRLEEVARTINPVRPAQIATVSGRYYAMDRDSHWERTTEVYEAIVNGKGQQFDSADEAIRSSYSRGITDEFIKPSVIVRAGSPIVHVQNGDAIIDYDFRPDRERQLTEELISADGIQAMDHPKLKKINDLLFVSMTTYQEGLDIEVAFPDEIIRQTLAEVVSSAGWKQFHTAETEKYAHVTYFINGRREDPFIGEDRKMVPSPQVATYDLQPEMSARLVTNQAIEALESGTYHLIILNYANGDMVGHTGNLEATILAVRAVDAEVGRLYDAVMKMRANLLITADHGKAEEMLDKNGSPLTAHTVNPVPLYLVVPELPGITLRKGGILADVAPTVLKVMGIDQPAQMSGKSLIRL